MNIAAEIMVGFAKRAALAFLKDELDDDDRIALCVAAGVPVDNKYNPERQTITFTTRLPVGFYKRDGRWVVAVLTNSVRNEREA